MGSISISQLQGRKFDLVHVLPMSMWVSSNHPKTCEDKLLPIIAMPSGIFHLKTTFGDILSHVCLFLRLNCYRIIAVLLNVFCSLV